MLVATSAEKTHLSELSPDILHVCMWSISGPRYRLSSCGNHGCRGQRGAIRWMVQLCCRTFASTMPTRLNGGTHTRSSHYNLTRGRLTPRPSRPVLETHRSVAGVSAQWRTGLSINSVRVGRRERDRASANNSACSPEHTDGAIVVCHPVSATTMELSVARQTTRSCRLDRKP